MDSKNIVILGATGSIGGSTRRIIRKYPEKLNLVGISANSNIRELEAIAHEFEVPHAVIADETARDHIRKNHSSPKSTRLRFGMEALCELASLPDADIVVVALVGISGLEPTLAAIRAKKKVILANKEVLVMAGEWVMEQAELNQVTILPADSEHNAIFQCLNGDFDNLKQVEKIILTASGGPFRRYPLSRLESVTSEEALNHPNWDMGPKVSLDSATMANKGLELIEARWLFNLSPEQLDVVIHPQSIIHSMIQYRDGSVIAQISPPDMTFPIQHCLFHPERLAPVASPLDFTHQLTLELEPPDLDRFPCLALAKESLRAGKSAPCVFNAANEIAGQSFLEGKIPFLKIPWIIDKTLENTSITPFSSLEAVCAADLEARETATNWVGKTTL